MSLLYQEDEERILPLNLRRSQINLCTNQFENFFFFLESMEKITTNEKNLDRFDKKNYRFKKKKIQLIYIG